MARPSLTCLPTGGGAVVSVLVCGEGACGGARAMLTGLDPHPAPTPLNNSVSISGTRLPYHERDFQEYMMKEVK